LVVDIGDKLKHLLAYLILGFLLSLNLHFQQKWEHLAANAGIDAFVIG
jgi:VanZ family protein